jgi:fructose-1,6-bisphosphatase II
LTCKGVIFKEFNVDEQQLPMNLAFDLVRITEATALAAGRWIGVGNREGAHLAATEAMAEALRTVDIDGHIVYGEEGRLGEHSPLDTGKRVGTGRGPKVDMVLDPIDGTGSVVRGWPSAISVACIAPYGSILSPNPAVYMDKIVVDRDVAEVLVPECMSAPVAWTLALVARAKDKEVRDLRIIVLDRPRHQDLIEEIRQAGARVMLRLNGDTSGAISVAHPHTKDDLLIGIGGAAEGVTAACAVKALGGAMLARLAPQSDEERNAVEAAGLNIKRILTQNELIPSNQVFFAATGITRSVMLENVDYQGNQAHTHSMLVRGETGTLRNLYTEYQLK